MAFPPQEITATVSRPRSGCWYVLIRRELGGYDSSWARDLFGVTFETEQEARAFVQSFLTGIRDARDFEMR
jgi:hypothetical protein